MLEAAVAAGVAAAGGEALLGGVLPTPGAPLLIARHGFDLGVVLSASHNPYRDNGIKFFGGDGFKLSDDTEHEIEAALDAPAADRGRGRPRARARTARSRTTCARCTTASATSTCSGRRIALDCANGATYRAAPEIFRRLGADVDVLADAPDGRNINAGCGSTHVERARRARARRAATTPASPSTATATACSRSTAHGAVVDGDELIALAALHLRGAGRLPGGGVAVTVMTNYGFHTAMREAGVEVATTAVGDRYVLEALRERDWALGGEQSGHIIDMGFVPSGDGIAAALLTLEALGGRRPRRPRTRWRSSRSGSSTCACADRARARGRRSRRSPATSSASTRPSTGRGRVLVRPSGTEPLVRVMVEAPDGGGGRRGLRPPGRRRRAGRARSRPWRIHQESAARPNGPVRAAPPLSGRPAR